MKQIFKYIIICLHIIASKTIGFFEQKNAFWHFPYGSNMGLFVALAVPIEVPNENVFVAYNFEANYLLPGNQSEVVEFPPLAADDQARNLQKISRVNVYRSIEAKMDMYGYKGHQCLLKTICEAASLHWVHNGILGDVIHIILTPSSSNNPGLPAQYLDAEKSGNNSENCQRYAKKCPTSFIDFFTRL